MTYLKRPIYVLYLLSTLNCFATDEATGIAKCSYKALETGQVVLEGLPDNLTFSNPWKCGRKKLTAILGNEANIRFRSMCLCIYVTMYVSTAA